MHHIHELMRQFFSREVIRGFAFAFINLISGATEVNVYF